ncbi:gtp-binding rhb1 [Trichoderma cornu-damae]|uniref:Gtp-binding rhb1 n=1 Tax=Trichoderma cornu-damae TaxID=654480 RepID=A0A9P8TSW2_9HYPO|nr:gtp-binding rhb1 [Trichoderma cornu-damae]
MEASPGLVDVSSARRFPQRLSAQELTRRLRGADTKDAKPIPLEAGSADLLETTSLAETQRGTGQNGAGAAKLSKDINARFPSINKRLETPPTRRRRLIDALAAEEANSARPGPSQSPGPSQRTGPSQEIGGSEHANENEHKYAQQGRPRFRTGTPLRRTDSDSSTLEKKKIKVTYSQSRSILQSSQESTTAESADYPPLLPDVDEPRKRQPSPIIDGGEDDESRTKIAIRSVHELRRAGANNRSSDEMDDLLSRIGAPGPSASTMRRNGLCELADKLQKKEFMNQFRDHASRDNIANGICDEKDAISGFLLATVFVIFLSSCPAPHMLQQLTKNRAGLWLSSLLDMQEDITAMATRKSANIPRATRGALANVKGTLLGMRIWHGYRLLHVSPRTMALQLLSMLAGLLDPHDVRVILDDAYASISKLRGYFAAHDSRDDVDYALTVCILEARSSSTAATGEAPAEAQREASEIAAFLRGMLQSWPKTHRDTDATLLRLAINTTNDEARAAAFRGGQLLSSLMRCVNAGFSAVQHAIHNSAFEGNIYDELLLILGIMINVLEHCPDARASPNANEIDRLAATWSESERSMEKVCVV